MSVEFFMGHAGYGVRDEETVEEGKRRGAEALVAAERWALDNDYRFSWVDDCYETDPDTCESCLMIAPDGGVVGSLSCIDDASPEYRRVVQAEIALEAMPS